MTIESLRRVRDTIVGSIRGLPKRGRLRRQESLRTLSVHYCRCHISVCKWEVVAFREGHRMCSRRLYTSLSLASAFHSAACVCVCSTYRLYILIPLDSLRLSMFLTFFLVLLYRFRFEVGAMLSLELLRSSCDRFLSTRTGLSAGYTTGYDLG